MVLPDNDKIYLAFIWHMHQPYYKNTSTNEYLMPWVRLHGTKDYFDMVRILKDFKNVKMTFNLVPSLLEQIIDYAHNDAKDNLLTLSSKPPQQLSESEKITVVTKFFMAHIDNMIKIYPRYKELFEKRGWAKTKTELERVSGYFSEDDIRDLQVWFNLVWFDPIIIQEDPFLKSLIEKDRFFTEDEKLKLLEKQKEILKLIIPEYKKFQDTGQIEISTTPFYHPILPLLYNTDFAKRCHHKIDLPHPAFSQPEDAREQIIKAAEFYKSLFDKYPHGFWPSEGSVCPEIIPFFDEAGAGWIATDEEILALSKENDVFRRNVNGFLSEKDSEKLYQPYWTEYENSKIAIIFRDHYLSDLIGFKYASWNSEDAAADLIKRIEEIAKYIKNSNLKRPPLISIILDGENCWEHYKKDGFYFLNSLYSKLEAHPYIKTTTVTDYLNNFPPQENISNLYTGSWIFHDFGIWIGHKEDVKSWEYLYETRKRVIEKIQSSRDLLDKGKINEAYKCISIAEGSDWAWWYGDDHSSGCDEEFDALFREHLMNACRAVNIEIPPFLNIPIASEGETGRLIFPRDFINPSIDGKDTNYYEWFLAGCYNPVQGGDSMHQVSHYIKKICFGFNFSDFFIRIDPDTDLLKSANSGNIEVNIIVYYPNPIEFSLTLNSAENKNYMNINKIGTDGQRTKIGEISKIAVNYIIEIAIPFSVLGIKPNTIVHLQVQLKSDGKEIEKCPSRNPLSIMIPDEKYYSHQWIV